MTEADARMYLEAQGWTPVAMSGGLLWGRPAADDPFALDGLLLTLWAAVALQERHETAATVDAAPCAPEDTVTP